MKRLIQNIEDTPLSVMLWCLSFASIAILRGTLESFSSNGRDLYPLLAIFIHPPLFYLSLLLSLVILLHAITKTPVIKLLRLAIVGFALILLPPLIDFVLSGGRGDFQMHYMFHPLPELVQKYFTLFGSNFTSGATYGIRTEFAIAIIFFVIYIFIKTHSWLKTGVGILALYTLVFVYGATPAIVGMLSYFPRNPWGVTSIEILRKFLVARDIIGIHFGLDKVQSLFSVEMSLIFIPLVALQLGILFYLWDRRKFLALFFSLRYLRLIFHFVVLGAGFLIGSHIFGTSFAFQLYPVLAVIALSLIVLGIWTFSLTINDLNDIPIDTITNTNRLLVRKVFTEKEFQDLGLVAFILAVVFSVALGYQFFVLTIFSLLLSFVYSSPPYRLKRFPFIATGIMSLGATAIALMGYLLFSRSGSLYEFPITYCALLIIVITLVLNVKDTKDIQGDKPNGIYTIPTIFGDRNGKIIIALLFTISYFLFPLVLKTKDLILPGFAFSALTAALIISKRVHENAIFIVYAGFLILTAFLVF